MNLQSPRLSPDDAPTALPDPAPDSAVSRMVGLSQPGSTTGPASTGPSENQKAMSALALAVNLNITDPMYHPALINNFQKLQGSKDTADYIQKVEQKITARRQ